MELKCVGEGYSCPKFELKNGQTTEGMDISEDKKKQMYEDYPGLFVRIDKEENVEFTVKTPEDNLTYKTKEDMPEKAKGRPKKA